MLRDPGVRRDELDRDGEGQGAMNHIDCATVHRAGVVNASLSLAARALGLLLLAPLLTAAAGPAVRGQETVAVALSGSRELVLDRRRRQLLVLEQGQELRRFPVAVGRPGWETPEGRFRVQELVADPTWEHPVTGETVPPGPANPLGSRWIGFHRDCRGRVGFNGREHLVVQGCVSAGFHGTPNRSSVGQAVSHGCVRLFDEHVRELFELVQIGTPVTVLP